MIQGENGTESRVRVNLGKQVWGVVKGLGGWGTQGNTGPGCVAGWREWCWCAECVKIKVVSQDD